MDVNIYKDSEVVKIISAQARRERVDSDKAENAGQ